MLGKSPLSSIAISSVLGTSANTSNASYLSLPSNYDVYDRTTYGTPLSNNQLDQNFININNWMVEDTPTIIDVYPTLNLDFVNNNVLDPRITFYRASTGTYYDGKTLALMEQNLFAYSNSFGAVVGGNLVNNGTFSNDISGWSLYGGATATWTPGAISATSSGSSNQLVFQNVKNIIIGNYYKVTFTVLSGLVAYLLILNSSYNFSGGYYPGSYSFIVQANSSQLGFWGSSINSNATLTNISIVPIEQSSTYWTQNQCTIYSNQNIDPLGGSSAYKIVPDTTTSNHNITYNIANNGVYTASIYAKAGEYNALSISDSTSASTGWVHFDLVNGVASSLGSGWSSGTITSVGNGWYRCTATSTSRTISSVSYSVIGQFLSSGSIAPIFTGDLTMGIYIYGAQFEQRSSVTAYTPTTGTSVSNYMPQLMTAQANVPRFDYDPISGVCKGLLIEENRTNLLFYSRDLTNINWTPAGSIVIKNQIGVDGSISGACLLTESNTFSAHRTWAYGQTNIPANSAYTFSFFVKSAGRNKIEVWINDGAGNNGGYCFVDLLTGTVSSVTNTGGTGTVASTTKIGNGWFRVQITSTNGASAITAQCRLYLWDGFSAHDSPYMGDSTKGILVDYTQLEVGQFASSPIATTSSSTVTRAVDYASITGNLFNNWYNNTQGTFYSEADTLEQSVSRYPTLFSVNDGYGANLIIGFLNPNPLTYGVNISIITPAANQINGGQGASFKNGTIAKLGASYGGSTMSITSAGYIPLVVTGKVIPSGITLLQIGNTAYGNYLNGHIRKLQFYPQAFSPLQLQYLTGRL